MMWKMRCLPLCLPSRGLLPPECGCHSVPSRHCQQCCGRLQQCHLRALQRRQLQQHSWRLQLHSVPCRELQQCRCRGRLQQCHLPALLCSAWLLLPSWQRLPFQCHCLPSGLLLRWGQRPQCGLLPSERLRLAWAQRAAALQLECEHSGWEWGCVCHQWCGHHG